MTNPTPAPTATAPPPPPRPARRWAAWAAAAAVGLVALRLLAAGGPGEGGARAGRYALQADELAALSSTTAATDSGDRPRWQAMPPRVSLDRIAAAGAGLAPSPDDRHAAAWRDAASGAEVTQITLLYDDPDQAVALLGGAAIGALAEAFDLVVEPIEVAGTDEARRWRGTEWSAVSVRRGGVIAFVAALGPGAPDPAALAHAVAARIAADPPLSPTP